MPAKVELEEATLLTGSSCSKVRGTVNQGNSSGSRRGFANAWVKGTVFHPFCFVESWVGAECPED